MTKTKIDNFLWIQNGTQESIIGYRYAMGGGDYAFTWLVDPFIFAQHLTVNLMYPYDVENRGIILDEGKHVIPYGQFLAYVRQCKQWNLGADDDISTIIDSAIRSAP
jgi:hypothetical protein